jgi:hypothetical protein
MLKNIISVNEKFVAVPSKEEDFVTWTIYTGHRYLVGYYENEEFKPTGYPIPKHDISDLLVLFYQISFTYIQYRLVYDNTLNEAQRKALETKVKRGQYLIEIMQDVYKNTFDQLFDHLDSL